MEKKELLQIKQYISNQVGNRVRLESKKRHNKSVINEGVIANVYPSIFTIQLNEGKNINNRTVSYSYTDILTNAVELTLHDQVQ
ncbi:MAG: Veg family protein [Defluviitaleaceae bacterium]|nr:Veg family protein [Defluviitaleaceae bacterium]